MSEGATLARVLNTLADHWSDGATLGVAMCGTSVELLGVEGAGLVLLDDELPLGSVGCSDEVMTRLIELELTLGEGPGIEAHATGVPVSEGNLANPEPHLWVDYATGALDTGAQAVFAFPLTLGAAHMGSLNLYRNATGSLPGDGHRTAMAVADVATHAILAEQADAPPDTLADELRDIGAHQARVHQATGVVAAQLEVSVHVALARLRAYAYVVGDPISEVADAIVARRLRLAA